MHLSCVGQSRTRHLRFFVKSFFLDMGPLEIPLSGSLELGVCVGAMSGGFALPCHR